MNAVSPNTIKLQAYLAHVGIASRRKSEQLIADRKVMVNGAVAHVGQRINPAKDAVTVDGKKLELKEQEVYMLVYKPKGVVSTTSDEMRRRTVVSLVPESTARLYPVGRLDLESEGLMLLTTDGALTNLLTHPRHQVPKTYHVMVQGSPTVKALDHLARGVKLKEGYTSPAEVEILRHEGEGTWLSITITEGWNRQIRRMLERVGYDTLRLIRVKLGPFTLEQLQGQRVRELQAAEVHELMRSTQFS